MLRDHFHFLPLDSSLDYVYVAATSQRLLVLHMPYPMRSRELHCKGLGGDDNVKIIHSRPSHHHIICRGRIDDEKVCYYCRLAGGVTEGQRQFNLSSWDDRITSEALKGFREWF